LTHQVMNVIIDSSNKFFLTI